jgi:plasmid stabilization system protein ParE
VTVRFSQLAEEDLQRALDYIAEHSPRAALKLAARIHDRLAALDEGTFEGSPAKLMSGESVRTWIVRPFRILYERDSDGIYVVRIYHGRRRPITR